MQNAIKIVQGDVPATYPEADYLRVQAWPDSTQSSRTLATIERVVLKTRNGTRASTSQHRVKTLLACQPMSEDDALFLATCYAQRKQIPLIVRAMEAIQPERLVAAC